jgi:DNA repair protein REV1
MTRADDVQAVSVDEALIDVTNCVALLAPERPSTPDLAKELAETIRSEVKKATGCEGDRILLTLHGMKTYSSFTVSIGIASNIMLARLATRRAKPAGSYHLLPDDVPEFLAPREIGDLWGFGWSTSKKAEEKLGVTTLGELSKKSKATLCDALGKGTGETLYKAIRGIDERKLESDKPRKSVSCEINVCFLPIYYHILFGSKNPYTVWYSF